MTTTSSTRFRVALVVVAAAAAIALVAHGPARAIEERRQGERPPETAAGDAVPQATTTTAPEATTTTTTAATQPSAPAATTVPARPAPVPPGRPAENGSAVRPSSPAPAPDRGAGSAPPVLEPLPPAGGDGVVPPPDQGPFPAHLRALMESVDRSGASDTRALLQALRPLEGHGLSPEQAVQVGFGRFPVGGEATYTHDWWFPRFGPGWRLHEGTDVFAAAGTPVRAPGPGRVRLSNGGLGGLAVYVVEADGTYYYLAHLAGIAPGLVEGAEVVTGQVVGYVGTSGNAQGGIPHVHFEVHPGGGGPVDPKPVLDAFLAEALAAAPAIVERQAGAASDDDRPPAVTSPPRPEPPRAALLWASAASPTGGALRLAEQEAVRAATDLARRRYLAALAAGPAGQDETDGLRRRGWRR